MRRLAANPRLRLLAGAALISFTPVFTTLVSVPPTTSAFWRVLIGGVTLVLWIAVSRRRWRLDAGVVAALVAAAVCFALDLWFWHRSILYVGPGLATLLANFQVFGMTLAGLLFLGQRPSAAQLLAIPLALAGLALIVGIDWGALPDQYRRGVVFGLLTALCYTGYLLAMRRTQTRADAGVPIPELAVMSLCTAALLGGAALADGSSLAVTRLEDVGWLLAYGVLCHVLGWLLITSSLSQVSAALVGLSLLLQPLLSFIWDILFFGRSVSLSEAAGASLALGAIYLGARSRAERPRGPAAQGAPGRDLP